MRTLITLAALAAFTAPALAGVLPIKGSYCGVPPDTADIVLNADGIGGNEDGCTFGAILSSGPHWWIVSQTCTNTDTEPKVKIEIKGNTAWVGFEKPYALHRCKK